MIFYRHSFYQSKSIGVYSIYISFVKKIIFLLAISIYSITYNGVNMTLEVNAEWQTKARGSNDQEYQIYLSCADNGKGGDITRNV